MFGFVFWLILVILFGLCLGFVCEWLLVVFWGVGECSDVFFIVLFLFEVLCMLLVGGVFSVVVLLLFFECQGECCFDWLVVIFLVLFGIVVVFSFLLLVVVFWLVCLFGLGLVEMVSVQVVVNLWIFVWCVLGLMFYVLFSIFLQVVECFVLVGFGLLLFNLLLVFYLVLYGQVSQFE